MALAPNVAPNLKQAANVLRFLGYTPVSGDPANPSSGRLVYYLPNAVLDDENLWYLRIAFRAMEGSSTFQASFDNAAKQFAFPNFIAVIDGGPSDKGADIHEYYVRGA